MVEHAGFTQPVSREEKIRSLYICINDADKKLVTYGLRRDSAIEELESMGVI